MTGSGLSWLKRFVIRLHEDGWIVVICLMSLVVMGGFWSLWRASVQEQQIREARAALERVDDMLQERTARFHAIEKNQHAIMEALKIANAWNQCEIEEQEKWQK